MNTLKVELPVPQDLENEVSTLVMQTVIKILETMQEKVVAPEWMKLKDAAKYAGTSPTTMAQWRKQGLQIAEPSVGGQYVSKKDIDDFLRTQM